MKNLIWIVMLLTSLGVNGLAQEKFTVEVDATGNDRLISDVVNVNNSTLSTARFSVRSGTDANEGTVELTAFANSYTASPGFGGYAGLTNRSTGIFLRAFDTNGHIRFMTGGSNLAGNTRIFINPVGQVGFGTDDPQKKIHLKEGDLYLDTASGSEVIMKSPNGTCYSITVSNQGALTATATTGGCPN